MAIKTVSPCTSATTQPIDTWMGASATDSLDLEKKLSLEPSPPMLFLRGDDSSTTQDSKASTAPSSGTNQRTVAQNSYGKRMRLLTASGLIAGITPTSTRRGSAQQTLDFAFWPPAGAIVVEPKAD